MNKKLIFRYLLTHVFGCVYFLMFNDLFGPLNFTIVNLKRRPAITRLVWYDLDSSPFILVKAIEGGQKMLSLGGPMFKKEG